MIDRAPNSPVFILSAHVAGNSEEANEASTRQLVAILERDKIPYKAVLGSYDNVTEKAYVINCQRDYALNLGVHFTQESILFLDSLRVATLIYCGTGQYGKALSEREEVIGTFVTATEEEAKAQDAWTYDRGQEQYYIVTSRKFSPAGRPLAKAG